MKYEGNIDSTVNQRIKSRLVEQEVYCCDTHNVEFILGLSYSGQVDYRELPFTYDDIQNNYPDYSDEIDELNEEIEHLEDNKPDEPDEDDYYDEETEEIDYEQFDEAYEDWEKEIEAIDEKIAELEERVSDLEERQETPNEIYEWWRVSHWLYEDLRRHGEPVIDGPNGYYWGRCCTGQAILLDWVISQIAIDMQILEGMEHDWSRLV